VEVLREWRRRLVGGTLIAVLAPAAIVGAGAAVGIVGGGIQGLGRLGQTLTGPAVPTVEPAPAPRGRERDAGDLLDRATRGERRARVASRTLATLPDEPRKRRRDRKRRDRDRPRGEDSPGARPPAATPPGQDPTPPPPQPPPPSTIRQIGDQVKQVTDDLPVAGPPAGQVIDLVVETAESLPIPPTVPSSAAPAVLP
jgi:hypothetical protein